MSRRGVPSRMWLKQGGGKAWFDPAANASRFGEIEAGIRERVRGFIEELLKQERDARAPASGSFGPAALSMPRARMTAEGGGTQE